MTEATLRGGSEADRKTILDKHQKYLEANADFD